MLKITKRIRGKLRRDGFIRTLISIFSYSIGDKSRLYISGLILNLFNGKISLHGVLLDLNYDIISNEIKSRIITGGYESEERYLCDKYLSSSAPVVELGGSIGYISCYLSKFIIPNEQLLVVEANSTLVPILQYNRNINNCEFDIIESAYHAKKDTVGFSDGKFVTGGHISNDGTNQIEAISLEDLTSNFEIGEFSLVCDIEGAESELVTKELDILKKKCKLVILEHHNNYAEIKDMLESKDFREEEHISGVSVYKNLSM